MNPGGPASNVPVRITMPNPIPQPSRVRGMRLLATSALGVLGMMAPAAAAVDFVHDVMPVLSRFGCNGSACHGKADGQNGFKLSIFGNDPEADFAALIQESRGRRISATAPENSLLLRKVTGEVGHGGGVRVALKSREYALLRDWVAGGLAFTSGVRPELSHLRLEPARQTLAFGGQAALKVWAQYADGSSEDVTWLSVFQSNNGEMAQVNEAGRVTAGSKVGQATVMARYRGAVGVFHALIPQPGNSGPFTQRPVHNFIDPLVDAQLRRLNVQPSETAQDAEYLRRAYLDIVGKLPTSAEARRFLSSKAPDKRAALVDELLARPEYADYWALKWADLLRVDRLALGHKSARTYYEWIHRSVAEDKPLDQFAQELLTAEGRIADQPAGYFFKVLARPGDMAATTSQVFMGVRITCAECHQHPFDRWTQQDYYGMRGFFQQVKFKGKDADESLFAEGGTTQSHPRTGKPVFPHPLGSLMPAKADADDPQDRRRALADWLVAPGNPWFARHMANRVWAHFLGRGIIEPVDDVRATNPPTNPELLDALAARLVKDKFSAKALIRIIAASRTYQLSSQPQISNEADDQNYSRALFRRLPAEVLMDAVCDTTGVPEKFPGTPAGVRAVQLWDSQVQHYFLKLFGRPSRITACECERSTGASISQVLHLMNGPGVHAKIAHAAGRVARTEEAKPDDAELLDELYLTFFSRFPSPSERDVGLEFLGSRRFQRRQAAEDLAWSLLNTLEFIFNH